MGAFLQVKEKITEEVLVQVPSPDFHIFLVASELQCCSCSWNSTVTYIAWSLLKPHTKTCAHFGCCLKRLTFVVARLGLPETEAQLKLKKTIRKMQHIYKAICLGSLFM